MNELAQRLVGTWVEKSGFCTYVFNADGTGTMTVSFGEMEPKNIFWGVSFSGELTVIAAKTANYTLFFPVDCKMMILEGSVFRKS